MGVAGVGGLPLDLPDEVLFEVLAGVSIMELCRLLRKRVSSRFASAIRKVFLEMASQAVRRACDLDEQGAVEDKAYAQVFKAPFIVSPPSPWVDRTYSDRTCDWRSGPLLHENTEAMYSGWPATSAEPRTWREGGRKLQAGLQWYGTSWGDPEDDWQEAKSSSHQLLRLRNTYLYIVGQHRDVGRRFRTVGSRAVLLGGERRLGT
jgi:uncharacterized protein YbdZ (MbtH family)